jgi:hypothetical protein
MTDIQTDGLLRVLASGNEMIRIGLSDVGGPGMHVNFKGINIGGEKGIVELGTVLPIAQILGQPPLQPSGRFTLRDTKGNEKVSISGGGDIKSGGAGSDGDLILKNKDDKSTIQLAGAFGDIALRDKNGIHSFGFHSGDADNGAGLWIGAVQSDLTESQIRSHMKPKSGFMALRDGKGGESIRLDGTVGTIGVKDKGANPTFGLYSEGFTWNDNPVAWFAVGKHKNEVPTAGRKAGVVVVRNPNGDDSILLDGTVGTIGVRNPNGHGSIVLDGTQATLRVGGGQAEMFMVGDIEGKKILPGPAGKILLLPSTSDFDDPSWGPGASIVLDGETGDIFLKNADCAEEFNIEESREPEPGTVMIIDSEDKLRISSKPYDKRVAGVISGAGDYKPGMILDKRYSQKNRKPLALVGKVYCKADACFSPIEVGDLLTTSSTEGHAMKAVDPLMAFGAIIGKALRSLTGGKGLIPILVALQ